MDRTLRFTGRASRGFTLIELMIGLAIGMLTCLAIAQVLSASDGYRRGTASGADAQVVGGVALYSMQREIEMSGYGIASVPGAIGCPLSAKFNNKPAAGFPTVMAPVVVTHNNAAADSLRVLSSNKDSYAVGNRLVSAYDPTGKTGNATSFVVSGGALNVDQGDLLIVAAQDAVTPCQVFQVNGAPTAAGLPRTDDNLWNATAFPDQVYPANGPFVINLGNSINGNEALRDVTFKVDGDKLVRCDYHVNTQTSDCNELQANVVNLKVFYGINSTFTGAAASHDLPPDTYTTKTPTTNIEWQQVRAVRLAVVVRSAQYERDEVSSKDGVQWVVGGSGGTKVDGAAACGSQQCVTLETDLDGAKDYTHYRYKVFDTVVPLRNLVWHS